MTLANNAEKSRTLQSISVLRDFQGAIRADLLGGPLPLLLQPGATCVVEITCQPRQQGMMRSMVMFEFNGFAIGRGIQVRCGDSLIHSLLEPKAPYEKRKQNKTRK